MSKTISLLVDKLTVLYATCLYIGYIKRFAQSIASFITLSIFYFIRQHIPFNDSFHFFLFLVTATLISIPATGRAEVIFKQKDSRNIVIDDVIGALIVVFGFHHLDLFYMVIGFILFRIYDNLNIFPVNKMEKLPGGWGVVMDDVIAGLMANLSIRLLIWIFPIS